LQEKKSEEEKSERKEETKLKFDPKQNNDVDFLKIMNGEEKRTTIMIRNIPNKFK